MPTLNSWGNQVLTANVTLNGGTCDIGSDATSGAINIGTGAAARTTTIGNGTGASSVVLNCGTGALNLGSNAIARTTTLGNTTGASVLALKYGTGDFTLASATGTVMSALDTGELTYPLQPAFSAYKDATTNDVTGNGTRYHMIANIEQYDRSSDYSTVTGDFTCPVDGIYYFNANFRIINGLQIQTTNSTIVPSSGIEIDMYLYHANIGGVVCFISGYLDLDAGDTVYAAITSTDAGGKIDDLYGSNTQLISFFQGHLVC